MRSVLRSFSSLALSSFCLAAVACGGAAPPRVAEDVPLTPPATATEPPADAPAPIAFETCSLETGGKDGRAECANVEVPLDWGKPADRQVTFFVKRLIGKGGGTHKQLWLLQGGPGGAGDGLEPLAEQIAKDNPSFDVYIPDHRGTGRSAFLDCPTALADYPLDYAACAAEAQKTWGKDGFATFTTTTAARDVGHVIERTREAGQEVHVYGVSYGTYWAQRYMQLFPTQATAVTLDSVCASGLCSYMRIGYWFDRVGKKFLAECAADATCSSHAGADPLATVKASIDVAKARTCAGLEGIDGETLRQIYSWFIASVSLRAAIPAVAARTVRCNDDDVVALKTFVSNVKQWMGGGFDGPSGGRDLSSTVLGFHIAFSEMEALPAPTRDELASLLEGAVFTTQDTSILDAFDAWPKYARDEYVGKYPTAPVPVLLMNGTLDPQTPQEFADEISKHYTAPSQTYVLVPRSAHCVVSQSETTAQDTCGMRLWSQFLAHPTRALDTSCTAEVLAHDFSDDQVLATQMFGGRSLWGSASPGAPSVPNKRAAPLARGALATQASLRAELERAMRATTPWATVRQTKESFARTLARVESP